MKSQQRCTSPHLTATQLELLCLGCGMPEDNSHLLLCEKCRQKRNDLDLFYRLLDEEINKPTANGVLDLAKQLGPVQVKYGLIVCAPIPEKDNHCDKAFRTKLLFAVNGDQGLRQLSHFNLRSLIPHNHIAARIITDPLCNNMLLHLWSPNTDDFYNWDLSIPGFDGRVHLNGAGVTRVQLSNIDDLDDIIIYFN